MKRIGLTPSDLEAFLAVAEVQSFSQAASELGLSQPAVTARIKHLEQVIGIPLFHRTTRRVSLTEAGVRLSHRVESTIRELRSLLVEFDDEANLRRGRVCVGASATLSSGLLVGAIAKFRAQRPHIEISLFDDFYGRALERLERGEVNVAILPYEPRDDAIRFEPLFSDPLVLVVSRDHRLAGRDRVALSDLVGETLVASPPQSPAWEALRELLEENGLEFKPTLKTRNPFALLAMIQADMGIGFVPRMLTETMNMSGVKMIELDQYIGREIGVAILRGRAISPATAAFVETLRDEVSQRFPQKSKLDDKCALVGWRLRPN